MRAGASISFLLVGLALSGPARRDCGQEKCYDAVNDCGMTYGGYVTYARDVGAAYEQVCVPKGCVLI